jgi:DNA-binding LytR/AlgR family response regulator
LNLHCVEQVNSRFGGQMAVLMGAAQTQSPVARDWVRALKKRLGS